MSVKEIEDVMTASWLAEYYAQVWDHQIETDLEAGRLDALLADVEQEYQAGLAQPQGQAWQK